MYSKSSCSAAFRAKKVLIVKLGRIARAVDQPDLPAPVERWPVVRKQMLNKPAHGRDPGAGGDQDRIGKRLAQREQTVRAVEADRVPRLHVRKQVRKEPALHAVHAQIEGVRAGRGRDGVSARLQLASSVFPDQGDKLARLEGKLIPALDCKFQVKALRRFGDADLLSKPCCMEFTCHSWLSIYSTVTDFARFRG